MIIYDLESVIMFASLAHKEQKMMEPDVPYLTHVVSVAINVLEAYYNGREAVDLDYALKLAILHDSIEDTSIDYDTILNKYGKRIADGVNALSKNKELPSNIRMRDSIDRIKKGEREVAIVKLADRCYNLYRKPLKWDDKKWNSYLNEGKDIVNELGFASPYLKEKLTSRIK